jgi:hypothetical protein
MARGKHKSMAERRVEVFTSEATIDGLTHKVWRLESEVARLLEVNAESKKVQAETVRALNLQVDERTSDEVTRLKVDVNELWDRLAEEKKEQVAFRKTQKKLNESVIRYLEGQGMSFAQALSQLMNWGAEEGESFRLKANETSDLGFKKLSKPMMDKLDLVRSKL